MATMTASLEWRMGGGSKGVNAHTPLGMTTDDEGRLVDGAEGRWSQVPED